MSKEPVTIAIMVAYLLSQLLGLIGVMAPPTITSAGAEFIIFLSSALFARAHVFSKFTLRQAGLEPSTVEAKASRNKNLLG